MLEIWGSIREEVQTGDEQAVLKKMLDHLEYMFNDAWTKELSRKQTNKKETKQNGRILFKVT